MQELPLHSAALFSWGHLWWGQGEEKREKGVENRKSPTLELTMAPVSHPLVLKAGLFLEFLLPHCLGSSTWGLSSGQRANINSPPLWTYFEAGCPLGHCHGSLYRALFRT